MHRLLVCCFNCFRGGGGAYLWEIFYHEAGSCLDSGGYL